MITILFYVLSFFVPLVLWPYSAELFEFNKMVLVYGATVLIMAAWLLRCLRAGKLLFRRTILDLPILVFLAALSVSTLISIDVRTSIFGYYSRFHGGLLSYLSYSLLYWAYVSNMDRVKTQKSIFVLLGSAVLVSIYGLLQHFGIDKNIWVQDVQNRIFSTLGQPNWLAAWIVALMPLTWALAIGEREKNKKGRLWIWVVGTILFYLVLLFTKSRSGLLGFIAADVIFWGSTFLVTKKKFVREFLIFNLSFFALALAIGTPFTNKAVFAPETGGTESGEIRKIVWQGAFDLWKRYPVFGTGPETFAYSYYETRPVAHNLVSEWDFLYNKAHNEYLNFAATTGTTGLLAYLSLIAFSLLAIYKSKNPLKNAFLAGYVSILVSNFFGFSVVPVALLFFMFPAMAVALDMQSTDQKVLGFKRLGPKEQVIFALVILAAFYALFALGKYWLADAFYAKGKSLNDSENFTAGRLFLLKATDASPKEAVFWSELSRSTSSLPVANSETRGIAISEAQKALSLSPRNLNLRRNLASTYLRLSAFDPNYLVEVKKVTEGTIPFTPTDAKLYYSLALTTLRLGQVNEALGTLEKAIELKPNYKSARFTKALILVDLGKKEEAKKELTYILEKIDPNDNLVKEELEKI